jgi:6-phospho-3-hexuloisomerase
MILENKDKVLYEINKILSRVDEEEVKVFIQEILNAEKIILSGAGRVGMAMRAFSMRLSHLGFSSFMLGDSNVPAIGDKDLLIIGSGSGETPTIYEILIQAKKNKSRISLITGSTSSKMALISNTILVLPAPSKSFSIKGFSSIQPMTTLNEQCLGILLDLIVLELMSITKQSSNSMWKRHSNLE